MTIEKDALEIIENDVQEQVNLVIEQINYEVKNMEEDQIHFFKEGLKKEVETYKEKELNDLRLFAATQASQNKLKTKRDLLYMRKELVTQLFDEVKQKIVTFTKSSDYKAFIKKKIEQIAEFSTAGYFEVRKEDVAIIEDILKEKEIQCDVKIALIQYGGFRYINPVEGFEIDSTLDFSLVNEMTWFQNNSGFTI